MPSHSASFRNRVQLVVSGLPASSLLQGWSEHESTTLGCTEGHWLLVPFLGPGITWKPPGCPMHSPAHDFPLGFYVPCCGIWAGRAAGQWGEEMITATSYPCLPCKDGFISLIPIPAFSLLFSLEGIDHLLKACAYCKERFHALGDQCGCPPAAPTGSCSLLLGAVGAAYKGTGTPPLSGAQDHHGADQGMHGSPAPLGEDNICMHLQTALPNLQIQPCQRSLCSQLPFALASPTALACLAWASFGARHSCRTELYPVRC